MGGCEWEGKNRTSDGAVFEDKAWIDDGAVSSGLQLPWGALDYFVGVVRFRWWWSEILGQSGCTAE